MKKIFLMAVLISLLILGGCKDNKVQPTPTPTATPTVTVQPTQTPTTLVGAENTSKVPDGWTVVSKYRIDIDDDGERETIRLCTDAKADDDGMMQWDDSHHWVLEMSDASNVFTLYDNYLHTGIPTFEVYENENGNKCINLTVVAGAGYSIKKFVYIKDKKAFEEQTIYSEENINHLYSSTPMY